MAKKYDFVNSAATTLNGSITAVATSLTVNSATGFPTTGEFFLLIDSEILKVTDVSGLTWTVVRGQSGSTAATHSDAADVEAIITKENIDGWLRDNGCLWNLTHGYEDWTVRHRLLAAGVVLTASDFGTDAPSNGTGEALVRSPSPVSGIVFDEMTRTQPSTPYTLTARVRKDWGTFGTSVDLGGIAGKDTSNQNLILLYFRSGFDIFFGEWDDDGGPSLATVNAYDWPMRDDAWLRLDHNGTVIEAFMSADGVNWYSLGTRTVGTLSTPNQIAWLAAIRSGNGHDHHLIAWLEH